MCGICSQTHSPLPSARSHSGRSPVDDTRTPVITIACWHKGCDFHELMEGMNGTTIVAYVSRKELWSDHNRKVHGRG